MTETVYILGAGANQDVRDADGITPPLINTFFSTFLSHPKLGRRYCVERTQRVWDYVERFWKLNKTDLRTSNLDLEECITLMEAQREDASRQEAAETYEHLSEVYFLLTSMLAELLSEFEYGVQAGHHAPLTALATRIEGENASVITLNYDCILERAIESTSARLLHLLRFGQLPCQQALSRTTRWSIAITNGTGLLDMALSSIRSDFTGRAPPPMLKGIGSTRTPRISSIPGRC